MKLCPNATHLALLQSIAILAVRAQQDGVELDTGPGGHDAARFEQELRDFEELLLYWLEPVEDEGGAT